MVGPDSSGRIALRCQAEDHDHDFLLSPEDALAVDLDTFPWMLQKPGRFSGGPLDGETMHHPAFDGYAVGAEFRGGMTDIDGNETNYTYRLRSIEPEWLDFEYVGSR